MALEEEEKKKKKCRHLAEMIMFYQTKFVALSPLFRPSNTTTTIIIIKLR